MTHTGLETVAYYDDDAPWEGGIVFRDNRAIGWGRKSNKSYGNGECVELCAVDPTSRIAECLGEVAVCDDKDRDGPCLPISKEAADALVAFAADPNAEIPGMNTTSWFDPFTLPARAETSDEARHAAWYEGGFNPRDYTVFGNQTAGKIDNWVATRSDGDGIELGAVTIDSPLRLIGCTAMRDSRFRDEGAVLIFSMQEMREFMDAARKGEFADPGEPSDNPAAAAVWHCSEQDGVVEYAPLPRGFDIRDSGFLESA